MKIGYAIHYQQDFHEGARQAVELEKAGLDIIWCSEAYGVDAISRIGYLAAVTEQVELGTGIINVYSRSASAVAQTAAGCDAISRGRFILGLGASGPQVIEGFHGIPYTKPLSRTRDYIEITRQALRRERIVHDGPTVQVPLPEGQGTGLGKPLKLIRHDYRSEIPIWWASLMSKSVRETARLANGWMPTSFLPEQIDSIWGDELTAGLAERDESLGPLDISISTALAIGDQYTGAEADAVVDTQRDNVALYWGGMGARDKNFYNTIARLMGYEAEAEKIQDLYLDGHKDEAAAMVPGDYLRKAGLVGPEGEVRERLAAWKQAGITVVNVSPRTDNPVAAVAKLRTLIEDL